MIQLAILCCLPVMLVAADPFLGTWAMNPAESTFTGIPPISMVIRFESAGENELNSRNEVLQFSGGKVEIDSCLWKLDGHEHKACNAAMIALKRRIDDRHIEALIRSASVEGKSRQWLE